MATVEYTVVAPNSGVAMPTGTTLEAGLNPLTLAEDDRGLLHRGGAEPENTVLIVSGTGNLVIKAGTDPISIARGYGDMTVAVAGETVVGPFESGRFMREDGVVNLEGTGLSVIALLVPRNT